MPAPWFILYSVAVCTRLRSISSNRLHISVFVQTGLYWMGFDLGCGLKNSSVSVCHDLFAGFMHALKCDAVIETSRSNENEMRRTLRLVRVATGGQWIELMLDNELTIRRMDEVSSENLGQNEVDVVSVGDSAQKKMLLRQQCR